MKEDNFKSNFLDTFIDIYKLGYSEGYDACKRKMELEALRRITKEDIARIVKNSIRKPPTTNKEELENL